MLASAMGDYWDEGDSVVFQYSEDGGATWKTILALQNNGSTYNDSVFIDTDLDGVGDVYAGLSATFKPFTVDLTFLSGTTTIDLRVIIALNSAKEDIAIDYIRIGDKVAATQLSIAADSAVSVGSTEITIKSVDADGLPVCVDNDVIVNLSSDGAGNISPTVDTIKAGSFSTSFTFTDDTREAINLTATDNDGNLTSASIGLLFVKNIIDNDIKYSFNNQLSIIATKDKISFINQGNPLKYDLSNYIEPFVQEKISHQSFGLGLYIVHNITKAHNLEFTYEHKNGYNYFNFENISNLL
jgi:hypothetical protein